MTGPYRRRDVERAIREYRERDNVEEADGQLADAKLLIGISLDAFDLPADARQYVEAGASPDTSTPVVVADADNVEDIIHRLELPDSGKESGFDAEALLADARSADGGD